MSAPTIPEDLDASAPAADARRPAKRRRSRAVTGVILFHRYLGLATALLFAMWFASGVVMIYAGGMPRLRAEERIERLPPLDLAAVKVTPAGAEALASSAGSAPVLTTVMQRPAYRFSGYGPAARTVFADNGQVLETIGPEQARGVAAQFTGAPVASIAYLGQMDTPDQWSMSLRAYPLYKLAVDDGAGTQLYVSGSSASVVLKTTRAQRALAWIGVIPHWLYFSSLRADQPLWSRIVIWSSGIACVQGLVGLVLIFTQYRRTRPFRLTAGIPYMGWMRWHYILGAVVGLFALTWAFSGLMSMEPWGWTRAESLGLARDSLSGGPADLEKFKLDGPVLTRLAGGRNIKEVEFTRIQGGEFMLVRSTSQDPAERAAAERLHQPYIVAGRAEPPALLVDAATLQPRTEPWSAASIVAGLKSVAPDAKVAEQQLLTDYDDYYYSRRNQSPLPVLRVKFDDPMRTWVYVDPARSQILAEVHKYNRIERWLYNGLHSLDFAFWRSSRPLWDIGVIALLLGGFVLSCSGFYLGVARLVRDGRKAIRAR